MQSNQNSTSIINVEMKAGSLIIQEPYNTSINGNLKIANKSYILSRNIALGGEFSSKYIVLPNAKCFFAVPGLKLSGEVALITEEISESFKPHFNGRIGLIEPHQNNINEAECEVILTGFIKANLNEE